MGVDSTTGQSIACPLPDVLPLSPISGPLIFNDGRHVPTRRKITKAVIPAAGYGTRMLPATKALPKEMLPVAGKPLIQYALEEAAASGIETVIVIVRHNKSLIQSHFDFDPALDSLLRGRRQDAMADEINRLRSLIAIEYIPQEKPFGLAHAICCAQPLLEDEPFAVLLPDVIMVNDEPVTRQLIRATDDCGGSVIAIREVEPGEVQRHGIVQVETRGKSCSTIPLRITGLVEKPSLASAPSRLGIFGRYVLEPTIWDSIAQITADAHKEVQLTDALNVACSAHLLNGVLFRGRHYDAGDRLGFLKANVELTLSDPSLRQSFVDYLAGLESLSSSVNRSA